MCKSQDHEKSPRVCMHAHMVPTNQIRKTYSCTSVLYEPTHWKVEFILRGIYNMKSATKVNCGCVGSVWVEVLLHLFPSHINRGDHEVVLLPWKSQIMQNSFTFSQDNFIIFLRTLYLFLKSIFVKNAVNLQHWDFQNIMLLQGFQVELVSYCRLK